MAEVASKDRGQAVQFFHALSDETRIRILERLREGEQCVCDLTEAFKTGQSRLSFHPEGARRNRRPHQSVAGDGCAVIIRVIVNASAAVFCLSAPRLDRPSGCGVNTVKQTCNTSLPY